jgi:hypothetical protein
MARKEIIQLSGTHILIGMAVLGNLLMGAFLYRYHSFALFRMEDQDLATFTAAQRAERDVKEEIRKLENTKSWNETTYALKNPWSADGLK